MLGLNLALAGCTPCDIAVINDPVSREATYQILDSRQGAVSLTISRNPLNRHILRLRSSSALPLEEQTKMLSTILNCVFSENDRNSFTTLFIGRLYDAFGKDTTLSQRLAEAASRSPLWDISVGGPKSRNINRTAVVIAEQAMIYRELKKVFFKYRLEISMTAAEKVLVKNKLPYDFMAWFRVRPVR